MKGYREHLIFSGSTIKDALIQLTNLGIDAILFVVEENDKLIGSITDGDVRRGLVKGISLNQSINIIIRFSPRYIKKGERDIQKLIEYREGNFGIIPIVDNTNKIVNVINFRLIRSYLPVDAVLMAGGRGNRLIPLTDKTPKPLLKVGNKPVIEHNLDRLTLFGIDDIWISVNYLGDQIQNFQHDYVLISNSDLLTNLDYEHFFLEFLKQDADMGVVTIPYQVSIPYAVLETNNGNIINFKEKPTYTYYSNGGIYLVKRSVLSRIPKDKFFNATDLLEVLILEGKKVFSYPLLGYWLDIGCHEDFEKAQRDIKNIKF